MGLSSKELMMRIDYVCKVRSEESDYVCRVRSEESGEWVDLSVDGCAFKVSREGSHDVTVV